LRLFGLVVLFLLRVIAADGTGKRAGDHGNIAPGAAPDQAADPEPAKATEYGAYATVVIRLHLRQSYLFDLPCANFGFTSATLG
jgi:hypothetical protein